jgi:hypothetical protein
MHGVKNMKGKQRVQVYTFDRFHDFVKSVDVALMLLSMAGGKYI